MKDILKSLFLENWTYLVIAALTIVSFGTCNGGKELQTENRNLKKENKELVVSAEKYSEKINELNDKIVLLEKQKQKVINKIVYVQKKTDTDVKKVESLSTKEIAKYYTKRYETPIIITKYGVSLSDTIAKKNIVELIQKDGCFQEVELFKTQLKIEEEKGIVKDTIIENVTKANGLYKEVISNQDVIVKNAEKALKKEKTKKTFWQITTGAIIIGASYLFITN